MLAPPLIPAAALHLAEATPPVLAGIVYLLLYGKRVVSLSRERRPVNRWRVASFVFGVLLVTAVQLPPLDDLADQVLVAHMVQHIVIGDIASLFIVLGLTGPVLQPLLHMRATRPLRVLASPGVALVVWALDLYIWHVPFFYQLAINHDLVHALEHACMLWFGTLLWLALIGPLPKPAWFNGWGALGYVIVVRLAGAVLGNVLIWSQTIFYPVYRATDASRGLNPLSDQNLAGAVMMVEESDPHDRAAGVAVLPLRQAGRGTAIAARPRSSARHRAERRARGSRRQGRQHRAAARAAARGRADRLARGGYRERRRGWRACLT